MKNILRKMLKSNIFKNDKFLFFKYHFFFFAVGLFLYVSLDHLPTLSTSFKETAVSDIDFSDLYYQSQKVSRINDSIIIINTGSLTYTPGHGRRKEMLTIMSKLTDSCSPKKIGVDLEYTDPINPETDQALHQLFKNEKIVIAQSKQNKTIFEGVTTANVNLPNEENHAIRTYYHSNQIDDTTLVNSFANACLDKKLDFSSSGKEFYLKYYCKGKGFYNILNKENEEETAFAFPAIEGKDILNLSTADLKRYFDHKIVLIGHLGEQNMHNPNDITDKHKSPTDFQFIFKTKIMPGVIVHANAIRQLQLGDKIWDCNWIGYLAISYVLTYIFLLIFLQIDRIGNVLYEFMADFAFATLSTIVIHFLIFYHLSKSIHINTFYIGLILLSLAELRGPFMKLYKKAKTHNE